MVLRDRDGVPSPCVSICTLDADGSFCTGCFRTLDEIARWGRATPDEKRALIAVLPARRAAAASIDDEDATGTLP